MIVFSLFRRDGKVGFSFGGGGHSSGSTKVVLTLDDLVFINTQVSKRVSSVLNQYCCLWLLSEMHALHTYSSMDCMKAAHCLLWVYTSSLNPVCEQKLNDDSIAKSQGDMKTPHHSVSGRSYLASTPDSSNIAVFEVRVRCSHSVNFSTMFRSWSFFDVFGVTMTLLFV